jgi:O-antigen/teichoic acid export membrane protein
MSAALRARPPQEDPGGRGPAGDAISTQIARSSALNLVGRLTYVVGWVVIAPYMLHRLGTDRFGLWSLLTVLSGLYLTFDLGVGSALTKFVAEYRAAGDHAPLRAVVTMGTAIYLGLSLVILAALALLRGPILDALRVTPALRGEAERALLVAAAVYGILNLYMLASSVLTGLHRMDVWNRIVIGVTVLQLGGVVVLLRLGFGLVALMLNTGASLALGAVLGGLAIRRLAPEITFDRRGFARPLLVRLTRYSAALQMINLGVLVQLQLDKALFGSLVSLAAVASYEFGFRVVSALWSVPMVLLPPLLPAAAHLEAIGDRARVRRLYRRAARYVFAVAFPIAAGAVALAPALYRAWLGPGHHDAALAASALAIMLGVNILTGVGSSLTRGLGRPGIEVRYQVVAMVLHVALSLVLIHRFGFAGGLCALVVSSAIGSLYFLWSFHRFLGEPLMEFARAVILRPLLAALLGAMGAAWAGGAFDPGLDAGTRGAALLHLGAGTATMLLVVAAVLLGTRFLSLEELRDLLRRLRAGGVTPRAEGAAGAEAA